MTVSIDEVIDKVKASFDAISDERIFFSTREFRRKRVFNTVTSFAFKVFKICLAYKEVGFDIVTYPMITHLTTEKEVSKIHASLHQLGDHNLLTQRRVTGLSSWMVNSAYLKYWIGENVK